MTSPRTILINPAAEGLPAFRPMAERLADLAGKRVALLDNIKHNAVYLLAGIGDELARRYGCEVRTVRKKTYTKPAEPHVLEALQDADAVVTAIGD